jgi:hypothetical protein
MLESSFDEQAERTPRSEHALAVAAELLAVHPWMTHWELRTALRERGLHSEPAQLLAAIARARQEVIRLANAPETASVRASRRPWWKVWGA